MWFPSWLRRHTLSDIGKRDGLCRPPVKPGGFRPRLEALEGRDVPSTLTVTNTLDDYTPGSLRDDIIVAHSGDTIAFDPSLAGQQILLSGYELNVNKNLMEQSLSGPLFPLRVPLAVENPRVIRFGIKLSL